MVSSRRLSIVCAMVTFSCVAVSSRREVTPREIALSVYANTLADMECAWQNYVAQYELAYRACSTLRDVERFVTHARLLQTQFFEICYVDPSTNMIMLSRDTLKNPYIAVQTYWTTRKYAPHVIWIVLQFDALARLFLADVCDAYTAVLHGEQRIARAEQRYLQLCSLVPYLIGSRYEVTYMRHMHRYQELLILVRS